MTNFTRGCNYDPSPNMKRKTREIFEHFRFINFYLKCYFDLFVNWTIETMYFAIYLFCTVFYIAFYLYNKRAVPISFLSSHQRSWILPRSWPSCSPTFPKIHTNNTELVNFILKIINSTNVTIGARNTSIIQVHMYIK